MHITSLPGNFGCGDLGPEAFRFADFLQRAGQTYWQLLPLNPVSEATGYSPYSSISAFAGNPLLISPEKLVEDGFLDKKFLKKLILDSKKVVDFEAATKIRNVVFSEVFANFPKVSSSMQKAFAQFCDNESSWLDDFALFVAIKDEFDGKPWYEWPDELKSRKPNALRRFADEHQPQISNVKLLQFLFMRQWQSLKTYCNEKGVSLFGDLPFYVSYDSADVWSKRNFFSISREGKMEQVAGVPPDYFNADGQLWGMPVFRWNNLKKDKFSWWVDRIRKNMQLYDVLRLDHFRAFEAFWSVAATEKTARKGKWIKAPGHELFTTLREELGTLPFIAEDLGDIDEHVHSLRTTFEMPGMKVLQFAFGDNITTSEYIPHNYEQEFVVYTGTHDNNTTLGWFRKDANRIEKKNLERYFDEKVTPQNINTLLIRLAWSSVAKTAIIPLQDLLDLDEKARMNAPATVKGNWTWRMLPGELNTNHERWLRSITEIFARVQS